MSARAPASVSLSLWLSATMGRELLGMQTLSQQLKRASRGPAARVLHAAGYGISRSNTPLFLSLSALRFVPVCKSRRVKDLARSARVSFALDVPCRERSGRRRLVSLRLFILAPRRMQIHRRAYIITCVHREV